VISVLNHMEKKENFPPLFRKCCRQSRSCRLSNKRFSHPEARHESEIYNVNCMEDYGAMISSKELFSCKSFNDRLCRWALKAKPDHVRGSRREGCREVGVM
jgi:hypothetical protein